MTRYSTAFQYPGQDELVTRIQLHLWLSEVTYFQYILEWVDFGMFLLEK